MAILKDLEVQIISNGRSLQERGLNFGATDGRLSSEVTGHVEAISGARLEVLLGLPQSFDYSKCDALAFDVYFDGCAIYSGLFRKQDMTNSQKNAGGLTHWAPRIRREGENGWKEITLIFAEAEPSRSISTMSASSAKQSLKPRKLRPTTLSRRFLSTPAGNVMILRPTPFRIPNFLLLPLLIHVNYPIRPLLKVP